MCPVSRLATTVAVIVLGMICMAVDLIVTAVRELRYGCNEIARAVRETWL